jgi:hypothetical protein
MLRRFIFLLVCLFPLSLLQAEEDQALLQENSEVSVFPLALILEAAQAGSLEPEALLYGSSPDSFWRPDWPADLPPDAFKAQRGSVSEIILTLGDTRYTAQWNDQGLVSGFPFFYEGELIQVSIGYNSLQIESITLGFPAGDSSKGNVEMEAMEHDGNNPSLLRVNQGGVYSFVLLRWGVSFISEAWYAEDGNALADYEYQVSIEPVSLIRSYKRLADTGNTEAFFDYDSRSLVTGISSTGGNFSVYYFHGDLPRYRELEPATPSEADTVPPASHYSLQWDENSFLVRLSGAADGSDEITDSRYEYDLDSRGNWIARREIKMVRRFGFLSPVQGPEITRILEYREDE